MRTLELKQLVRNVHGSNDGDTVGRRGDPTLRYLAQLGIDVARDLGDIRRIRGAANLVFATQDLDSCRHAIAHCAPSPTAMTDYS